MSFRAKGYYLHDLKKFTYRSNKKIKEIQKINKVKDFDTNNLQIGLHDVKMKISPNKRIKSGPNQYQVNLIKPF